MTQEQLTPAELDKRLAQFEQDIEAIEAEELARELQRLFKR